MSWKKYALISVALLVGMLWVGPVDAQSAGEENASSDGYGVFYGDGLRHYAEGRPDMAVESLFRAYGTRPGGGVMELIVEVYDSMGHCDAALRQIRYLGRAHSEAVVPGLDRCATMGELIVECAGSEDRVSINGVLRGPCGEVLRVPAGASVVVTLAGGERRTEVVVEEGVRERVEMEDEQSAFGEARVKRLSGWATRVDRLPLYFGEQARVSRLSEPSAAYRIYESEDGIYQVWMRSDSVPAVEIEQGEMRSPSGQARVEIICPEDAPDGQEEEGCQWLRQLRRQSPEAGERLQRFEVLVPRVP